MVGVGEVMAWPGMAWHGLAWHGLAWPGLAWTGLAWIGLDCGDREEMGTFTNLTTSCK